VEYLKHTKRTWRDFGTTVLSVSPLVIGPYENVWQVPFSYQFRKIEKVSANTPNYSKLKATGAQLPSNNYSYQKHELGGDLTYVHRTDSFVPGYGMTHQFELRMIPFGNAFRYGSHSVTADWSSVDLQLLKKLKGETWQAGVALAEAGKTAKLITNTAQTLVLAAVQLKKGHLGDVAKTFGVPISNRRVRAFKKAYGRDPNEAAANMWLELQYGWKPLLKDVHDASKALSNLHDKPNSYTSTIRTSLKKSGSSFTANHVFSISPAGSGELLIDWSASYRYVITYGFDPVVSQLQSMELLNPATIVWELIPFSFVADWFVPIGDYLATLDAAVGKSFLRGTRSVRLVESQEFIVKHYAPGNQSAGGGYFATHETKVREKLSSFPPSSLPKLDVKLGLEKMVSSVALLHNQLRKFGRG
jgi:hypothetical protein